MRKLLTLIITLCVFSMAQAKASETKQVIDTLAKGVATVYNDVKSVTPELKKALEKVSQELGVATANVWSVIVKQQKVNSIVYLTIFVLSSITWLSLLTIVRRQTKYDDKINRAIETYAATMSTQEKKTYEFEVAKEFDKAGVSSKSDLTYVKVVLLILASAGSITTAWNFKSMVTGFLNPEYGAMQQLTELVLHLSAK